MINVLTNNFEKKTKTKTKMSQGTKDYWRSDRLCSVTEPLDLES